jgi:chloride channel protein, CIC family
MKPDRDNLLAKALRGLAKDNTLTVLLLAAAIGYSGGLLVYLFRLGLSDIRHFFDPQAAGMVDLALDLPWWGRLLLPVAGGALAGALLEYGLKKTPREGSGDYLEAIAIGDGKLSLSQTLVKSVASICSISSGASIGREGPMVQLAAMAGSLMGRGLRLSQENLRLLVACGATAGLAAAYNAPIAGLLFIVEIAYGSLSRRTLTPLIVAAVIAVVVTHRFYGIAPVYRIPEFTPVEDWETLAYAGLGVACGLVAPCFRLALDVSRRMFARFRIHRVWTMALGGLGVGLISVGNPDVWGNGYSVVNSILHTHWTWQALLAILALKIAATSLSYGSGAMGGVFTPTIFVGAALGALYGHVLSQTPFGLNVAAVSYAIVGMGAFLSSITYAPLMSILMIYEMTLSYEVVLPLMLACVISHHVALLFREDSVYESGHGRSQGQAR